MKPLDMPELTAEQIEAVATLYRTTHNVRLSTGETKAQVAREFGISRETLYQYLRKAA